MAESDNHILEKLGKGKFPKLYIGIYGAPSNEDNKSIIQKAKNLTQLRSEKNPLSVSFYDSMSANVWGGV